MKTRPRPGAEREKTERVYGLSAALAAFERRPDAVISIAHTKEARRAIAELLREAASRRIAYREVDAEELARMAESIHHEGICLLMRRREPPSLERIVQALGTRGFVLALDGVQNPHNVGAILRSAAYFGVGALIYAGEDDKPLAPAARRVAEGGAERVTIARVPQLSAALRTLADRGLTVIGSDSRAKLRLDAYRWPARSILVVGHEQTGLSAEVRAVCATTLRIAGVDGMDSLNVSVAAGVFMASFAAQAAK
ncbi:MAG TPA: RNA methyltransferase [Polyangiales bacterium]|nr:RNA methyltransferase [Polyangiales bacterium]